jgi:uncharacterized protein (DUF2336 family)
MGVHSSLMTDLEDAIKSGSQDRRVETLRRVTDLFLGDVDRLNEAQVAVFDDVLCHLITRIEAKAVAELSARLAPVDNAPIEVIRKLARDDEIAVAKPVLTQSARLSTHDLVEIARTKSQAHLLAISGRAELEEPVTDQLLIRGDSDVAYMLAGNAGARFSASGLTSLVRRAEADDTLAMKVGLRLDLPSSLLRELLSKATEAVRDWLLSHAAPDAKNEVQRVIASISNEISREVTAPRDFAQAQKLVLELQNRGQLSEATILEFAKSQKYEDLVAALSASCSTSIQLIAALMRSHHNGGLLVPCKAAGLKWPPVATILRNRFTHHVVPDDELVQARRDYLMLSQASAQRTLRFWLVRTGTAR